MRLRAPSMYFRGTDSIGPKFAISTQPGTIRCGTPQRPGAERRSSPAEKTPPHTVSAHSVVVMSSTASTRPSCQRRQSSQSFLARMDPPRCQVRMDRDRRGHAATVCLPPAPRGPGGDDCTPIISGRRPRDKPVANRTDRAFDRCDRCSRHDRRRDGRFIRDNRATLTRCRERGK